jgi:uncharacterized phage protein gp47/JayE
MATADDVASRIIDALSLSDAELDTAIGTPLRNIIDAVSQQIALTSVDPYLVNYQYDVDSRTGGDLDDFCANFGIARLPGIRATGTLTFTRTADLANFTSATIPAGTQVTTGDIAQQVYLTTITSTMAIGQTSVDVPGQALNFGPDANIAINTPLQISTNLTGVTSVSNTKAFTGGVLGESDEQLRTRFKQTVFRNLAGTESMYRGIALQAIANNASGSFGVARINLLDSATHNTEQIQIVSGTGSASLTTAAFFLGSSVFVSDSAGKQYQVNVDYTQSINNTANPATLSITAVSTSSLPDGFYTLDYDYVSISSRNDPNGTRFAQGIVNNRIDLYVNGQNPANGTQTFFYRSGNVFSDTSTDRLYRGTSTNKVFVMPNGSRPPAGSVFIPLAYGPILDLNLSTNGSGQQIIAVPGGATYVRGTDFDIVHRDDAFGYAPGALYGLVWLTSAPSFGTANNSYTLNYTYNQIPYRIAADIAQWRLLGTDVKVHAGKAQYMVFNFAIVYEQGFTVATVNSAIQTALDAYLKTLGFRAALQVSDVTTIVHNVPGVDNVRLLNSTDDATNYGMQAVQSDGTVIKTYHDSSNRPADVYFDERTYPLLFPTTGLRIIAKGRNTFRP